MRSRRRALILVALAAILGAVAASALRTWGVYPVRVTSSSMSPTLVRGDWLVVHRLTGRDRDAVRRRDIVVFRFPFGSSGRAVKRVVAVSGDSVEIGRRYVKVNGVAIPTSGGPDLAHSLDGRAEPLPFRERIPARHVFLLGDNGVASIDSRSLGPVPDSELVGRVSFGIGLPAWRLSALMVTAVFAASAVSVRSGSRGFHGGCPRSS